MLTSPKNPAVLLAGSDEAALASLRPAAEMLASFGVEARFSVIPAGPLDAPGWGDPWAVIVASPDGALPAAMAAATEGIVLRVPTENGHRRGIALLNDGGEQLPAGEGTSVFATMAIGEAGAKNAALFLVAALAVEDDDLRAAYADFRARQTEGVLNHPPLEP